MTDPEDAAADAAVADDAAVDARLVALANDLFDAARRGDVDALTYAIDAGAPADLTDRKGDTLLMLAAYHGHDEAVRVLLARGATADRRNHQGQTPLAGAVFKQERAIVQALLDAGADPDAGAPSPRATAGMFGLDDIAAMLDAAGR